MLSIIQGTEEALQKWMNERMGQVKLAILDSICHWVFNYNITNKNDDYVSSTVVDPLISTTMPRGMYYWYLFTDEKIEAQSS